MSSCFLGREAPADLRSTPVTHERGKHTQHAGLFLHLHGADNEN